MADNRPTLQSKLDEGPVLCAEGYLFEFERRGYLQAGAFVPEVVLDHPDSVRELHKEFLRAGSDVMVAFTYYAHREKLRHIGREGDLEPMNRQALQIAKEVANEGNVLLAGNVCNTWAYDLKDPAKSESEVRAMYEEQIGWAKDAGADFILSETHDFLAEALISIEVAHAAGLPVVVNFASIQSTGEGTLDGYGYLDACRMAADKGAEVVGLNCTRGPRTIMPLVRDLVQSTQTPVAAVPVPYRTDETEPTMESLTTDGERAFPAALDPHVCTRKDMADFARDAVDAGARFIGVCCGGAPHHVRGMAEALGRSPEASRYSAAMNLHPQLGDGSVGWTSPESANS